MRHFYKSILLASTISLAIPAFGQSFEQGLEAGRRHDYATALANFEPLAKQGDRDAQYNLGMMYEKGWGLPRNDGKAAMWYYKAAEKNVPGAQLNLGVMYYQGRGVSHHPVMSYFLFNLAISGGEHKAQKNRRIVVRELSRAQIKEGQRMYREWQVGLPLPDAGDFNTWP